MRSGDELRKSTLSMARAAVKNAEIQRMSELDDAAVQDVLRKEIKQRKELRMNNTRGHRQDLADRELAEAAVLEAYLPQQMSEGRSKAKCAPSSAKWALPALET